MSQTTFRLQVFLLLSVVEFRATSASEFLCPERNLTVTVDNFMRLYIDGIEITNLTNADSYTQPDVIQLPCTTRLIAIHGRNGPKWQLGGILASTDDGYVLTNSSWKCSNVSNPGWEEIDFDDSAWAPAIEHGHNGAKIWEVVPGINPNAFWIWLRQWNGLSYSTYEEMDMEVYCRKRLNVDEYLFGQPINECDPSMGRCIRLPARGYNCSCHPGYQNDGQHKCKDVDECLLGPPENKCNASSGNCINIPGSYKCRCYQGFTNVGDQRCEGSSNNSKLPLILGVSLGVSLLIIVALIVALSILCSRTSTSKDQVRRVVNTGANRSDIVPKVGNISSNKPSSPEGTYAHLTLNALRNNESDNYEQIIQQKIQ